MHFNVQSATSKKVDIEQVAHHEQLDIIMLNETFLKPNKQFKLKGYTVHRHDRSRAERGGVCICIRSTIPCLVVSKSSSDSIIEWITIRLPKILPNGEDLHVASVYNPPDTEISKEDMQSIISNNNTIVAGDLNAHNTMWNSAETDKYGLALETVIGELNLNVHHPDSPTYAPLHRLHYAATLDLVITMDSPDVSVSKPIALTSPRSDHLPILFTVESKPIDRQLQATITKSRVNWEKFKEAAKQSLRPLAEKQINTTEDIDELAQQLESTITRAINETTTTATVKSYQTQLLPKRIVTLIKERRKLQRSVLTTRSPETARQINKLAEQIKKQIEQHKQDKWREFCTELNQHRSSDSTLWRKISSIENANTQKPDRCPLLKVQEQLVTTPTEVANTFAEQLKLTFTPTKEPEFYEPIKATIENTARQMFKTPEHGHQSFQPTTAHEIMTILKDIRGRGAPGADKITNKALKQLPEEFHQVMANVANSSMKLSHIPKQWKHAEIVMIPKPGKNPSNPTSYRPISLLSTMSKIIERVMKHRMLSWIHEKQVISKHQSGFMSKRQTRDHIFRLIQTIQHGVNDRKATGAIFIDIEKAFDKLWHEGLLFKMAKKQCPAYIGAWIRNYLNDRTFQVRVQSSKSTLHQILCGVPQGSVLGPLLFNIFIDDIIEKIKTADKGLFADDLSIWVTCPRVEGVESKLQQAIEKVEAWSAIWRMKLSTTKTVCTLFTRINGQGNRKLDIKLYGKRIKHDNKPKLLGLKLDKNLTFYDHIQEIKARVHRRINMMRSIRGKNWGASPKLLLTTYKTLIRPIMEYIPFVKYSASESSIMTLEMLQRKAVKIAFRLPISTATKDCYKLARIDNIKDRFESLSKRYLQKATNNNQLIKELIDKYNPSFKPRVKNGVKPILGHLLPQTTQSTAQTTPINKPTTTATINQATTTTSNNQPKTMRKDNWQKLIEFVDQLDL